jgi:hypothetical protein
MDNSPLGTLPAEMRNQIFEIVLIMQDPIKVGYVEGDSPSWDFTTLCRALRPPRLCTEICEDHTSTFYALNAFEIDVRHVSEITTAMDAFMAAVGHAEGRAVTSITFNIPGHGIFNHLDPSCLREREQEMERFNALWNAYRDLTDPQRRPPNCTFTLKISAKYRYGVDEVVELRFDKMTASVNAILDKMKGAGEELLLIMRTARPQPS